MKVKCRENRPVLYHTILVYDLMVNVGKRLLHACTVYHIHQDDTTMTGKVRLHTAINWADIWFRCMLRTKTIQRSDQWAHCFYSSS